MGHEQRPALVAPMAPRSRSRATAPDHAFIGLYDVKTRTVWFIEPGVDRDTNPTWSHDGKQLAFVRRPGTPFGQQSQGGIGGVGNPAGPAAATAAGRAGAAGAPGGRQGGATQAQRKADVRVDAAAMRRRRKARLSCRSPGSIARRSSVATRSKCASST